MNESCPHPHPHPQSLPRRILIVAPAWVGDMVMAHTLVQVLEQRGAVTIDMVAPPATAPLAERMPAVRACRVLEVGHGELGLGRRRALAGSLRSERYEQSIVLPNSLKSALLPWLAGIPLRTGWHGESRFGLLNDRRREQPARYPLMIERFMALGLPEGAPLPQPYPLPALQVDEGNLQRLRSELGLGASGDVLALCPGAEFGPAKRWPASHYAEVAREAAARGREVWLLGSPREAEACAAIQAQAPAARNLAGRTRLLDAVDLLAAASLVVCNDSGLMHVACAVGSRVVALYGSTSPRFTPPLGAAAEVLRLELPCSPCFQRECPLGHLRCLRELSPRRVVERL